MTTQRSPIITRSQTARKMPGDQVTVGVATDPEVKEEETEDSTLVPDMVSTALRGLNQQLAIQNATGLVPSYAHPADGNIRDWIRELDKVQSSPNFDDTSIILLAWQKSKGVVSDYINRWRLENSDGPWTTLRTQLLTRFGDIVDEQQALSVLRSTTQKRAESVQAYSERLFDIARRAYGDKLTSTEEDTRSLINQELVGIFMDGLTSHSLKIKVCRARPNSLQQAIEIAIQEEVLHRRFDRQVRITPDHNGPDIVVTSPPASRTASSSRSPTPTGYRTPPSSSPIRPIFKDTSRYSQNSHQPPFQDRWQPRERDRGRTPHYGQERNNTNRSYTNQRDRGRNHKPQDNGPPTHSRGYSPGQKDQYYSRQGSNTFSRQDGRYTSRQDTGYPAPRGQPRLFRENRGITWGNPVATNSQADNTRRCFSCGSPYHLQRQCFKRNTTRRSDNPARLTCFQCGRPGHIARDCRHRHLNEQAREM